jgi:hypothetical protein
VVASLVIRNPKIKQYYDELVWNVSQAVETPAVALDGFIKAAQSELKKQGE